MYSCDTSKGTCYVDAESTKTQAACAAACKPTMYSCNLEKGNCFVDKGGSQTQTECGSTCKESATFGCNQSTGDCEDGMGAQTQAACKAVCKKTAPPTPPPTPAPTPPFSYDCSSDKKGCATCAVGTSGPCKDFDSDYPGNCSAYPSGKAHQCPGSEKDCCPIVPTPPPPTPPPTPASMCSCNKLTGQCAVDAKGNQTQSICSAACKEMATCDKTTGTCTADAAGTQTMADCSKGAAACKATMYSCNDTIGKCAENAKGNQTQTQCGSTCEVAPTPVPPVPPSSTILAVPVGTGAAFALGIVGLLLRRRRTCNTKAQGDLRLPLLDDDAEGANDTTNTDTLDDSSSGSSGISRDATSVLTADSVSISDNASISETGSSEHDAVAVQGAESNSSAAPPGITVFGIADLSRSCAKFTKKIGEGAFGAVFSGQLPDGRPIAVKQMELAPDEQKKKGKKKPIDPYAGEAGFRLELEVLSKYVHPNLVILIGYCVEKPKKKKARTCSLVLEFMAGGSLLERLKLAHAGPPLAAQERFDIAADVARALHYLHADAATPLIHQDVKTDNILLCEKGGRLFAKVADFGTARIAPQLAMHTTAIALGGGGGQTHHSTLVIVGTKPYMPAEYLMAGHISEKTDTFAYGVMLLELLTGRPPYDEETDSLLHMNSMELMCDPQHRLAPVLDARVPLGAWAAVGAGGEVSGRALELSLLARRCLEMLASVRGTMREVMPSVVALAAV
jgi:hypothetical protein